MRSAQPSTLFPYTTLFRSTLDIAIIKRLKFKERYTAEFRAEVFNLTNTPPLGAPNSVVGSPGFGSITSDRKSTRLNSSHRTISYAVFCLKKKKTQDIALYE